MSKTSTASKAKYNAKAYDRIALSVPKGVRDRFRAACEKNGETMNGLMNKWIKAYLSENEEGQ